MSLTLTPDQLGDLFDRCKDAQSVGSRGYLVCDTCDCTDDPPCPILRLIMAVIEERARREWAEYQGPNAPWDTLSRPQRAGLLARAAVLLLPGRPVPLYLAMPSAGPSREPA